MRWQIIARPLFQKKSQSVNFRKVIHQMVKNEGVITRHTLHNNESKLALFLLVSDLLLLKHDLKLTFHKKVSEIHVASPDILCHFLLHIRNPEAISN